MQGLEPATLNDLGARETDHLLQSRTGSRRLGVPVRPRGRPVVAGQGLVVVDVALGLGEAWVYVLTATRKIHVLTWHVVWVRLAREDVNVHTRDGKGVPTILPCSIERLIHKPGHEVHVYELVPYTPMHHVRWQRACVCVCVSSSCWALVREHARSWIQTPRVRGCRVPREGLGVRGRGEGCTLY